MRHFFRCVPGVQLALQPQLTVHLLAHHVALLSHMLLPAGVGLYLNVTVGLALASGSCVHLPQGQAGFQCAHHRLLLQHGTTAECVKGFGIFPSQHKQISNMLCSVLNHEMCD